MTTFSVINDLTSSKEKYSGYSDSKGSSHEGMRAFEVNTKGHVL